MVQTFRPMCASITISRKAFRPPPERYRGRRQLERRRLLAKRVTAALVSYKVHRVSKSRVRNSTAHVLD